MGTPPASSPVSPTVPTPLSVVQNQPWSKHPADQVEVDPPVFEFQNGVATITIPDEILLDADLLWKKFVVGYFIGEAPHVGSIHATINRIWNGTNSREKFDVQFIEKNTVLIRIESEVIRSRVLRRKFWHVSDVPLVLSEWSPISALSPPDLSNMPLWVDLEKVPSHLFSDKGLRFLAKTTGKFVKLHPKTERCIRLDVARVLVEVNLEKPLTDLICFKDIDGSNVSVKVSYPWLPLKCSVCHRWGHAGKDCKQEISAILQREKEQECNTDIDASRNISPASDAVKKLIKELESLNATSKSQGKSIDYSASSDGKRLQVPSEDETTAEGHEWITNGKKGPNGIGMAAGASTSFSSGFSSPTRFHLLENIEEEQTVVEPDQKATKIDMEEGEIPESIPSDELLGVGDITVGKESVSLTEVDDTKDTRSKQKTSKKKVATIRDLKLQHMHQTKKSSSRKI